MTLTPRDLVIPGGHFVRLDEAVKFADALRAELTTAYLAEHLISS